MKQLCRPAVIALAGIVFIGCATTSLSPEEQKQVGPWCDMTKVLVQASDPDLVAPCKTGIPALDPAMDVITAISSQVNKMINYSIRKGLADVAWNEFVGWKNGPEAGKLSGEALAATELSQAKFSCFEAGMALNSKDAEADAKKVLEKRKINPTDEAAKDAFLKQYEANKDLTLWATALKDNFSKGRQGFYDGIGCSKMPSADPMAELQSFGPKLTAQMQVISTWMTQNASQLAQASLSGGEIIPGVKAKEVKAALARALKQGKTTLQLLPWLIDAIKNSKS